MLSIFVTSGSLCTEISVIFDWPMRALNCEDVLNMSRQRHFIFIVGLFCSFILYTSQKLCI